MLYVLRAYELKVYYIPRKAPVCHFEENLTVSLSFQILSKYDTMIYIGPKLPLSYGIISLLMTRFFDFIEWYLRS